MNNPNTNAKQASHSIPTKVEEANQNEEVLNALMTEVDVDDLDTVIEDKLTCAKCQSKLGSRSALIKHLKVKHQILIVGAKRGRPSTGGKTATYIRKQQKKKKSLPVVYDDKKKTQKQLEDKLNYEASKAKIRHLWILSERNDLLEAALISWQQVDGQEYTYEQYMKDIAPMYDSLITDMAMEDSYPVRVNISLCVLEMMFERFPGVFNEHFHMASVLHALTPLKVKRGSDKEQAAVRDQFRFEQANCLETKNALEGRRRCKSINTTRLDILHKLCFLFQIYSGYFDFDLEYVGIRSGIFCSLFESASF